MENQTVKHSALPELVKIKHPRPGEEGYFVPQDKADFNGAVFCDDKQDAERIYLVHNAHDELVAALKKAQAIILAYEEGHEGYPKALILQPEQAGWPEEIAAALKKAGAA